jgi:O-antigen biosynthesis alpha-1,3-rhamnosyltransferase
VRVVVNLLVASGRKTGIGHYASELVRCLSARMGADHLDVFPGPWLGRAWSLCSRLRPCLERKRTPAAGQATGGGSRTLGLLRRWGQSILTWHFQRRCHRQQYDVYHEPNNIPLPSDVPTVLTIHDLSVLLHPEWHPADRVVHYERHFLEALPRCAHFVAVSEFSRQELIRTFSVAPERVTRTYLGVRPGLRPLPEEEVRAALQRLGLPPRYLLYLGTLEPRKNVLFLLRTYASLPERVRGRWPLLLVGPWGWNTGPIRDYFETEARHRGVLHLGYVGEEDLAVVYNGARALVFPSLYEGFGLPPVEMMACGGAVLISTAGALVETVGGRAHVLAPDDVDGWRQALVRVVEDADWWRWLRRDVTELAGRFTWEKCAAETLGVYRSVSGEPRDVGSVRAA